MRRFALAYLALAALFWLPLACSMPAHPLAHGEDLSDTAYALRGRPARALDSLDSVATPRCVRVWDANEWDSAWRCPDPRPPAPLRKQGHPLSRRKAIFPGMDYSALPDHELRDRIAITLKNLGFWEAKGDAETAAAYREQLEVMRVEGRKRGFTPLSMGEDPPRPARRLPG